MGQLMHTKGIRALGRSLSYVSVCHLLWYKWSNPFLWICTSIAKGLFWLTLLGVKRIIALENTALNKSQESTIKIKRLLISIFGAMRKRWLRKTCMYWRPPKKSSKSSPIMLKRITVKKNVKESKDSNGEHSWPFPLLLWWYSRRSHSIHWFLLTFMLTQSCVH